MKIQNIENVEKFLEVLDQCKGKVEIVSSEGDRINIKSKLSQFFVLSKLLSDSFIKEVELVAYEKEDIDLLFNFMLKN